MSAAMMLRYSFGQEAAAKKIEYAVDEALTKGARTKDIAQQGEKILSTSGMADAVIECLEA
jgi:3-isopropylmalate dehydrogenase